MQLGIPQKIKNCDGMFFLSSSCCSKPFCAFKSLKIRKIKKIAKKKKVLSGKNSKSCDV